MKGLEKTAPEVHAEFMKRNFVVSFNQVPTDQATKWMNKTCKMHNGIIGITRNDQARDKFCITYTECSHISHDTRHLLDLEDDEEETTFVLSDSFPSQVKHDIDDVKKLVTQLTRFDVYKTNTSLVPGATKDIDESERTASIPLVSLTTSDIAPHEVETDLLTAEDRGKQMVIRNVKQRLVNRTGKLHDVSQKQLKDVCRPLQSKRVHKAKSAENHQS